jgi:SpoIID/LytB domain protein
MRRVSLRDWIDGASSRASRTLRHLRTQTVTWAVALVAAGAVTVACATMQRPKAIRGPVPETPAFIRVRLENGPIRRVALEDYARAAALSEFAPPSGDQALIQRMLEVQTIIARTYAVAHRGRHRSDGFDLCSTTHCQLYQPARLDSSMWAAAAKRASEQTAGMVLWYGSLPARAVYHADCGGRTSAATEVWRGDARPYLAAAVDDGPAAAAHTSWHFEVDREPLRTALNADARTRVGRQLAEVIVHQRDSAGRVSQVTIRGTRQMTVRGEDFRAVLSRAFGPKAVRSTRFEVKSGSRFVFDGRGYGHGVGLCQAGAFARLQAGARLEQVLARYYPGTRLVVLR